MIRPVALTTQAFQQRFRLANLAELTAASVSDNPKQYPVHNL